MEIHTCAVYIGVRQTDRNDHYRIRFDRVATRNALPVRFVSVRFVAFFILEDRERTTQNRSVMPIT